MSSAAAIVVVVMGAFALLPPVKPSQAAVNDPVRLAPTNRRRAPRE